MLNAKTLKDQSLIWLESHSRKYGENRRFGDQVETLVLMLLKCGMFLSLVGDLSLMLLKPSSDGFILIVGEWLRVHLWRLFG